MAKFVPQAELPVSEQAQIRREKLAALQAEGRDPFVQTKFDFDANSVAIKDNYEKIVLTLDTGLNTSYDGIKSLNLVEWLLGTKY